MMGIDSGRKASLSETVSRYFYKAKRYMGHILRTANANVYLRQLSLYRRAEDGPVRVAFIVQMPEVWDKEAPVFEAMLEDYRFAPRLIVVPSYDMVSGNIGAYGSELEFFLSKYGEDHVLKAHEEKWLDLKAAGYEYVFYQRCYETYLPEEYHTVNVIRYAKTVYIPYFYQTMLDQAEYYRTSFFECLYMFFCCSDVQRERLSNRRYGYIESLGYPAFEMVPKCEQTDIKLPKRILWTPRWTDDPATGGSTFLKYLGDIADIKKENVEAELWLRPHPLAFSNAVREGKLSENDVISFHSRMKDLGIVMDTNKYVEDTLASTDILITDLSSIIVFYFMSGKPIIYCANTKLDYVPVYRTIIDCSYIADSFSEVRQYVKQLLEGNDPLRDRREKEAEKFRMSQADASGRILDLIAKDSGFSN